jgi:hypothetical protein
MLQFFRCSWRTVRAILGRCAKFSLSEQQQAGRVWSVSPVVATPLAGRGSCLARKTRRFVAACACHATVLYLCRKTKGSEPFLLLWLRWIARRINAAIKQAIVTPAPTFNPITVLLMLYCNLCPYSSSSGNPNLAAHENHTANGVARQGPASAKMNKMLVVKCRDFATGRTLASSQRFYLSDPLAATIFCAER